MTDLIYLLGAGRSGTTLLATVLNSHSNIQTVGEMHQFAEHLADNRSCSCGETLEDCPFWEKVVSDLESKELNWPQIRANQEKTENHGQIPRLLCSKTTDADYLKIQETVFKTLSEENPKQVFLDSSKYIGRYLALKKSKTLNLKGIYLVRDLRGVVNSFQKNVQTPKKPLAAILYYWLINLFGELVYRTDKKVLKVRYEDFIDNPQLTAEKIYSHIFEDEKHSENLPGEFEMPHIIGGNRMKKNKTIKFRKDVSWKQKSSRLRQVVYYLLAAPLMLINRYKV